MILSGLGIHFLTVIHDHKLDFLNKRLGSVFSQKHRVREEVEFGEAKVEVTGGIQTGISLYSNLYATAISFTI